MPPASPSGWSDRPSYNLPQSQVEAWQSQIAAVARRYSREYRRESFDLPAEVEAMPVFQEWASGKLAARKSTPFWELAKPKKNQHCLDLGCGVSFLVYPWLDWQAYFHGQEISTVAHETLNSRSPQLNSKLFKGVRLAPAHQLDYGEQQFDLVIAIGFSCYYGLDYWRMVMTEVRKVLKPGGKFVFDVLNSDLPLAENWAILETYLGADVELEALSDWKALIKDSGAKLAKQKEGELFHAFSVQWG